MQGDLVGQPGGRRLIVLLLAYISFAVGCSKANTTLPYVESAKSEDTLARGRYLAEAVAVCIACHSERDYRKTGGPIVPGTAYAGGPLLTPKFSLGGRALPGRLQAPNITQDKISGLGLWGRADIRSAVQRGVARDGTSLLPLMPYRNYRYMQDDDVQALLTFLQTIAPISNETTPRELNTSVEAFSAETGKDLPAEPLDTANSLSRGRYLVVLAGCSHCHTPNDEAGRPDMSRFLAGGVVLKTPEFEVVSQNLTPEKETGLGRFEYLDFKAAMREGVPMRDIGRKEKLHGAMPWYFYRKMTDADLESIWAFLRSIPPIHNEVGSRYALSE